MTSGYSGTPLAKKLGIKTAFKIKLINAPGYYFQLFTDMPLEVYFEDDDGTEKNLIHLFPEKRDELVITLPVLKTQIKPNGIIWVSWPKKTSKIHTDVTKML